MSPKGIACDNHVTDFDSHKHKYTHNKIPIDILLKHKRMINTDVGEILWSSAFRWV